MDDLPARVATHFAERYGLDLSYASLTQRFEQWLPVVGDRDGVPPSISMTEDFAYDYETGAACYLGEVLARRFGGVWRGELCGQSGANYYTSYLEFGSYTMRPFTYVGYRFANGVEDTGTVGEMLSMLEPCLSAGRDLKREWIQAAMDERKLVIDTLPWI